MTLDGYCDHTAIIADEELHQHYTELLRSAGTLLYGRITYQLMESYWPAVVEHPTGTKPTDEFAVTIDRIPKIVFSRTLNEVEWNTARVAKRGIKEEVTALKESSNGGSKPILAGSRSVIVALLNLHLIDEFQLCVHPVITGDGLPLLEQIHDRINLTLVKTKTFGSGAVTLYYEPVTT